MSSTPSKPRSWLRPIDKPVVRPRASLKTARLRLDPSIPKGWPDYIRDWLQWRTRDRSLSAQAREIYEAILHDQRLDDVARILLSLERQFQPELSLHESVIRRLKKLPLESRRRAFIKALRGLRESVEPEPLVTTFLDMAVTLAERARYVHKLPTKVERLRALGRAASDLLDLLPRERDTVWMYLARNNPQNPRWLVRDAPARYKELFELLRDVQLGASTGRFAPDSYEMFFEPTRVRGKPSAAARYFLRGLVAYAEHLFQRPLHKEAGLLATVCLGLPEVVTARKVQEYSRPRR